MWPVGVASVPPRCGRRGLERIAVQPFGNVDVVVLLVPQHTGERLTLYQSCIGVGDVLLQLGVKFVGFGPALIENAVEIVEPGRLVSEGQSRPQPAAFRARQAQLITRPDFGTPAARPDGRGASI